MQFVRACSRGSVAQLGDDRAMRSVSIAIPNRSRVQVLENRCCSDRSSKAGDIRESRIA